MACQVASLGYMQTRGFKTFIASDLDEIFSLTLAPGLMKTCYYTCHVASHQQQPQSILGLSPQETLMYTHLSSEPCKNTALRSISRSRRQSQKTSALAPLPRPALIDHKPEMTAGARFPNMCQLWMCPKTRLAHFRCCVTHMILQILHIMF